MRLVLKFLVIFFLVFFFSFKSAIAQSEYVLPYPSFMPGSKFYPIHKVWEGVMKYWHFGEFGQFTYNQNLSDKYIVEAKTLFEYKQYLFALDAIKNSNKYFSSSINSLEIAKHSGKDISQKKVILKNAAEKHIEVIGEIKNKTPEDFLWQPEKSNSERLNIKDSLLMSIYIRQKAL